MTALPISKLQTKPDLTALNLLNSQLKLFDVDVGAFAVQGEALPFGRPTLQRS